MLSNPALFETDLETLLRPAFGGLPLEKYAGTAQDYIENKLGSAKGAALIRTLRFEERHAHEGDSLYAWFFEVSILARSVAAKNAHQVAFPRIEAAMAAMKDKGFVIDGEHYDLLAKSGLFAGEVQGIYIWTIPVQAEPRMQVRRAF